MTLHVTEVARVTPAPYTTTSLTIPLTFFDLPWLVFHPVKRVFFYRLTNSTHDHFNSTILPKLKLSLSLVLANYLPLLGHITWNPNEPKPNIVVSPNDSLSLTITETDNDFTSLSSYGQRPVSELHTLFSELHVSDDSAAIFSLQITFFPNQGFSIGVAAHHGVLDGKTATTFVKTWSQICKLEKSVVDFDSPSYDRSLIKDLTDLDEQMIQIVRSLKEDKTKPRSLTPLPARKLGDDVVLATFMLSKDDMARLRKRLISESKTQDLHLSTFSIAYAHAWTCLVKARGSERERRVSFLFVADYRARMDPPLPDTYFGNCVFPTGSYNRKAGDFMGEGGFVTVVEILSDLVKGFSSRKVETIGKAFVDSFEFFGGCTQFGTIAGSNRLGVYESDFGWGKPVKVDIVSIDQGEAISLAESRDKFGGVEIGMCLKKTEMDIVLALFNNDLQN